MITLTETKDYKVVQKIIADPMLWQLTYGQVGALSNFVVDETFRYLLLEKEGAILGCFQVKPFTNTVMEIHSFILPGYWGTDTVPESVALGHEWVKSEGYRKTWTKVPATCIHVLKYLQKNHYVCSGMIEEGIVHNHHLVTLFFYEFEV
jgi:hypothetical protein